MIDKRAGRDARVDGLSKLGIRHLRVVPKLICKKVNKDRPSCSAFHPPSRIISGSNPRVALKNVIMPLPIYKVPKRSHQQISSFPHISLRCRRPENADVYLVKCRISLTQPGFCSFKVIAHNMRRRCQSCESASLSRVGHPGRTSHRDLHYKSISS